LELRNVVIENSVSQEGGGAITSSADVTIENSILKNNISIGSGGAISAMETVTVIDSNFESNTAVRPAGSNPATENGPEGGAIYSEGKVVSSNTIFSTNVAEIGGAISARSVEINQSVFISNQANLVVDGDASWFGMGGAIALKGAGEENLIEDSEFALNSAGSGGALVVNTPAEFPAITNLVISATTFS
jgi:hypothetical protein